MVRSQRIVANLGREDLLAVTNVIEMDYNAFVESKPSLEVINGVAHVETHNYENFLPTILSSGRYATEIGCKSKTQESIVDALDYDGYGPVGTCKEVHLSIYDWVLRNVAPRTRQRFLTREKQLQFSDDAVSATGAQ